MEKENSISRIQNAITRNSQLFEQLADLYKINYFEFYRYEDVIKLKDDPTYDQKAFEERLEIKGDDDHSKLITMLEKLNDYTIPIETVLDEHFDIENITYWMAFHILIGNADTQSRNVYFYSPLNSEKWYFITWDNDGSLQRLEYEIRGRVDYAGWENGVSNYWGNVLFQRCLKSEKFRDALEKAVKDLKAYLTKNIGPLSKKYASIVKPYVYSGADILDAPLTSGEYDAVVKNLPKEIETNYDLFKKSYDKPQPFYIGVPRKNGDKMVVEWDASYDFDAQNITYSFELARDPNFTQMITKKENLVLPTAEFPALSKGQYFMRVIATNEDGLSQYAFDYYIIPTGKIYGTKCFYVNGDGKIVEDIYDEG